MAQKCFPFNEFAPAPRKGTSAFLPDSACFHGRPQNAVREWRFYRKVEGASPNAGEPAKRAIDESPWRKPWGAKGTVKVVKPAKRAKE